MNVSQPSREDSIKFLFDNFNKEFASIYTHYGFCGLSSEEPYIVYPYLQGNLLQLREAIELGVSQIRHEFINAQFLGEEDESLYFINKDSVKADTLTFLQKSPDILDHYVFIGVRVTEKGKQEIVILSSQDELYALYCGRRLVDAAYDLLHTSNLKAPKSFGALEVFDRVLIQILRSLVLFEKSRQPSTSLSVILLLIDSLVYQNYPLLEEGDRQQIKEVVFTYLKETKVITDTDIKQIEKVAYKNFTLEELQGAVANFITNLKDREHV